MEKRDLNLSLLQKQKHARAVVESLENLRFVLFFGVKCGAPILVHKKYSSSSEKELQTSLCTPVWFLKETHICSI